MRRATVLAVLALTGCKNESSTQTVPSSVEVVPDLSDPGDVAVGAVLPLQIQIAQVGGGAVTVSDVVVRNVEGSYFAFDGVVPMTVDVNSVVSFDLLYAPTEAGWHYAEIDLVNDSRVPTITIAARAHAVEGVPALRPLLLDFGPVAPDATRTLDLVVLNEGSVEMPLLGAVFSQPGFEVVGNLPIVVPPVDELAVPIRYTAPATPAVAEAVSGTLELDFGGPVTPPVLLRANDCEHGTSDLYDTDGDGWTACSGDCDDGAEGTNPARVETVDGVDQDCDGLVDEGTDAFDDDADCRCEGPTCVGTAGTCGVISPGDCNDGTKLVSPSLAEIPSNGVDDDCDGVVDQGSEDRDGDGYSAQGGDCDDDLAATFPFAQEKADGQDNDCDGVADEGTTAYDDDGDGQTEAGGDCDDGEPLMRNGAPELPDRLDNDCDGRIDEGTTLGDDDGDGFNEVAGDCDDANPARNPGQYDVTGNSLDEDCNGSTGP